MNKLIKDFEKNAEIKAEQEYQNKTQFQKDPRLVKFEKEILELKKYFDYREDEKISYFRRSLSLNGFSSEDIDYIFVQSMGLISDKEKRIEKKLNDEWEELKKEAKNKKKKVTILDNILAILGYFLIFNIILAYVDKYLYNGLFDKVYKFYEFIFNSINNINF